MTTAREAVALMACLCPDAKELPPLAAQLEERGQGADGTHVDPFQGRIWIKASIAGRKGDSGAFAELVGVLDGRLHAAKVRSDVPVKIHDLTVAWKFPLAKS